MRTLLNKIRKLLKDRRTRRLWSRTISIVAALVVFVTTYALVLPAITMERQAYCGLEAHQHTDECFERRLICTIPESPGHHHDDSCYTMRQEYSCTLEEHIHAEGCYDEEGNLICKIPEHTHEEGTCWQEVPELTCTLEESDGHQHGDSCYENVLVCGKEVHTHSEACYENPDEFLETAAVATTQQGAYGISTDEGFDGAGADDSIDSDGSGDEIGWTDSDEYGNAARSDVMDMTASEGENDGTALGGEIDGSAGSQEAADGLTDPANAVNGMAAPGADVAGADVSGSDAAGTDNLSEEAQQDLTSAGINEEEDCYVPQLDPLAFDSALRSRTGIYYYHVREGETIEDSSLITEWKKVDKNTELGPNDLLRVYLSYTIPAGSLNETNPTASYRLPANLHLTDDQVNGINAVENGIAAAYIDYNTLTVTDPDNYHKYLGAEAVEGTRTPDQTPEEYLAQNAAGQEFISATVRAQNVYDAEGLYGEKGAYLGQDLIFTFSPYTIEKNQHTYDASGQPTRAGEKVRGWFAIDFNLSQVDLDEPYIEEIKNIEKVEVESNNDRENENADEYTGEENTAVSEDGAETTVLISRELRTADIVFVEKDDSRNLDEISTAIKVVTAENYERAEENPDDTENIGNTENSEENGEEQPEESAEGSEENLTGQEAETGEDTTDADSEDKSDADAEDKKDVDQTAEDDKDKDKTGSQGDEPEKTIMPAMSFEDSIRVRTGKPAGVEDGSAGSAAASAAESLPRKAKVTVRVEADEGTFPAGTTMALSAVEDLDAVAETVKETVENGDGDNNGNTTADTENKNPRTYGFQAVDISFRDADGNEIEPAKPVRVALTSEIVEQIKADKETNENTSIADPVVVHLDDDGNAEKMDLIAPEEVEPAQGKTEEELREEQEKAKAEKEEAEKAGQEEPDLTASDDGISNPDQTTLDNQENAVSEMNDENPAPEDPANTGQSSSEADDQEKAISNDQQPAGGDAPNESGEEPTVFFQTDSFSVYAIVYTVDFKYSVNGKMYQFSLPGGGFVSFTDLVEVLGIIDDTNAGENEDENGSVITENAEENAVEIVGTVDENATNEEAEENGVHSDTNTSLTLGDVVVSDASKKFVADVESVEFSDPELVWVGKIDEATTVGDIKEAHGLACEYSAELTEEKIAEINSSKVEADDWALISVRPFTSEETLTVTMKNGEQFMVKVTDAQISTHVMTADGKDYVITVTYDDAAQIPEDAELKVTEITDTDARFEDYLQKTVGRDEKPDAARVSENGDADEESMQDAIPEGAAAAWSAKPVYAADDPAYVRFFDIEIQSGGQKVEPKAEVFVQISLANVPVNAQSDLQVVHFAKDGMELMDLKDSTGETEDISVTDLSFVTDEFSVYSIVSTASGTVDDILNKDFVLVCNNVAVSPEQNTTYNYTQNLKGIPVTINGNTISTTEDSLPVWQIHRYWNPAAGQYYYQVATEINGVTNYLHIANSNGGRTYVDTTPQDLRIVINGDHTRYRFYRTDSERSLDLVDNNSTRGFGTYDGIRDREFFTLYELGTEIRPHVTVHFVDRDGYPLEDVQYTGENSSFVTKNADGTFEIPYNWKGTSGTVNLETEFSLSGYTYANAHLAKTSTDSHWTGSNYNQNGLVIDSTFTSNGTQLSFKSYKGNDSYKDGSGNGVSLETYRFDQAISAWTYPYARDNYNNAITVEYAAAGNKDVYVILDPKPTSDDSGSGSGSGSGGEGSGGIQPSENDPNFKKKLESNGDGTYTLSLSVTGHALNNTEYPRANVLLVVDTSSSMTNPGYTAGKKRIQETKGQIEAFTDRLFALNGNGQEGQAPTDTVEVAMFSFDGSTHDLDLPNQWMTTESQFDTALGQLYTHKGTNWEDALQKAYTTAKAKKDQDNDPTFVIFFTDGEPSQYTNFHQSVASNNPSSTDGWKYFHPYLSRETANDEARQIVREGLRFYSVFAYGDDASYNGEQCTQLLHNLVKYGYNKTENLTGKNFFDARNATDMTNAFTKILHAISSQLGITDVVMNDSITSLTRVGISNSNGEAKGFKYTRSGGQYGETGQPWTDAPLATYDNTGVHWDLSKDKNNNALVLEDGVTYTVSFTVWPTQQAYDYVTQLNNGFITLDHIPEADRSCFKYNETTGKYEVVTNPISGPDGSGNVVNETSYKKTESETVTELPPDVTVDTPIIKEPGEDDWPKVKTTTTYTLNPDGTTWTKTVVTEVINAFNPPDKNMTLTNSAFNVEKEWQLGNRPEEMVAFLYDTTTGKVIDAHKNITFVINQVDNPNDPESFAQVKLGFDEALNDFNWADATSPVTVQNITYQVGRKWRKDLDISVGLMLSPGYAQEHNIFLDDPRYIPVYSSMEEASSDGEILYYVLETGHDYLIDEPTLDYRFDFETEVYHPMLVNGEPQNVKVEYKTISGKTVGILTDTGEALSSLQGRNILRGELDMKKTVLDPVGNVENDNTEVFDFIVTLENNSDPGPFYNGTRQKVDDQGNPVVDEHGDPVMEADPDAQNIPWYGVHREGEAPDIIYYYHQDEPLENGDILYVNELTACIGGNYLNGLRDGYSGNQMIPDTEHPLNIVKAEIKINAKETWTITNVPGGTTYTIREKPTEGYEFVDAKEAGNTSNTVRYPDDPEITGAVRSSGGKTEVEFRNQRQLKLDILKVDVEDLNATEPDLLPGAAFRLEKYANADYRGGLDTSWGTEGQKTASEKEDDPGKFRFIGIAPGYYKLVETAYPDGYIKAESDPIFRVVRNDQNNRYEIQLLEINSNGEIVAVENNQSSTVIIDDTDNEIKLLKYGNTPGAELPHTGGPGTRLFTIFGSFLILGAGVLLWRKRRTI